jgi:hypothetical protein
MGILRTESMKVTLCRELIFMSDQLTPADQPSTKNIAVELSVTPALLPNLLYLIREWLAETGCKPLRIERAEAPNFVMLRFQFAAPECASAFRYAFERS